ncbi:hypothetical protein [Hellea balneolensis]|uniref:hypothetical protein n=1 Tax=Hellea balneolensis TaxID=287478 RepID=UPI00047EAD21|nr:hypothetical protein [Hellea balneolensis]
MVAHNKFAFGLTPSQLEFMRENSDLLHFQLGLIDTYCIQCANVICDEELEKWKQLNLLQALQKRIRDVLYPNRDRSRKFPWVKVNIYRGDVIRHLLGLKKSELEPFWLHYDWSDISEYYDVAFQTRKNDLLIEYQDSATTNYIKFGLLNFYSEGKMSFPSIPIKIDETLEQITLLRSSVTNGQTKLQEILNV